VRQPAGAIRFVTANDGVRISYQESGNGPVLVRAAHWLSHLEFDRWSPIWRPFLDNLAQGRTLLRYDERGTGLSDREVADLSFEAMVADLELLVDTLDLRQFALLGMSQGGAISIAYAARHPERVTQLVLCGAYARGHEHADRPADQRAEATLLLETIRVGWGKPEPKFRRVFAEMFIRDGSTEEYEAFDQLQRVSATPETAYRLRKMFGAIDVTTTCRMVQAPTLVMHAREDGVVPFEEGRLLAALIPNAQFVPLDGRNHMLLPEQQAFRQFFDELNSFTGVGHQGGRPISGHGAIELSSREHEVMALVAAGFGNREIADQLSLSPRTIERHLSNVYAKLGLTGRSARTAAVAEYLRHQLD